MMLFCVRDMKAGYCYRPFAHRSVVDALRDFGGLAKDQSTPFGLYPHDFRLQKIGEFDEVKGIVVACDPQDLGSAADVMPVPPSPQGLPVRAVDQVDQAVSE